MFRETMTPAERMLSLRQTGWADRPAIGSFAKGFIAMQTPGLSIGEYYRDPIKLAKSYIRVWELYGFDTGPSFGHACCGAAEFGGELTYPGPTSRAQSPMISKHPVTTPDAVDAMEIPDPAHAGELPKLCEGAKYVMDNYPAGYKSPSISHGDAFSWAVNVVGAETLLEWMVNEPELVHIVLKKVSDYLADAASYIVKTVGPIVCSSSGPADSNDLISPKQFEEFSLPYLIGVHQRSVKAGLRGLTAHPCGNHTQNIHMWAKVPGVTGINFDYRTPLDMCVEVFGDKTMVIGNIEPAKFLYSDYDWIYNKTLECMDVAATKSKFGYMVGPGCEMPTSTPGLYIAAMVQATRHYAESKEWQEHKPK
jgi:uroporphyrinogen decarboxylase